MLVAKPQLIGVNFASGADGLQEFPIVSLGSLPVH